jgi:hypothetical protein
MSFDRITLVISGPQGVRPPEIISGGVIDGLARAAHDVSDQSTKSLAVKVMMPLLKLMASSASASESVEKLSQLSLSGTS